MGYCEPLISRVSKPLCHREKVEGNCPFLSMLLCLMMVDPMEPTNLSVAFAFGYNESQGKALERQEGVGAFTNAY